jgi:hypothetical protein
MEKRTTNLSAISYLKQNQGNFYSQPISVRKREMIFGLSFCLSHRSVPMACQDSAARRWPGHKRHKHTPMTSPRTHFFLLTNRFPRGREHPATSCGICSLRAPNGILAPLPIRHTGKIQLTVPSQTAHSYDMKKPF